MEYSLNLLTYSLGISWTGEASLKEYIEKHWNSSLTLIYKNLPYPKANTCLKDVISLQMDLVLYKLVFYRKTPTLT